MKFGKLAGAMSTVVSSDYTSNVTVVTVPLIGVKILNGVMATSEKSCAIKVGP